MSEGFSPGSLSKVRRQSKKSPRLYEGILARLKSGPGTRLPQKELFCSLHHTQDFWRTTLAS
jgi:hypothetical protein